MIFNSPLSSVTPRRISSTHTTARAVFGSVRRVKLLAAFALVAARVCFTSLSAPALELLVEVARRGRELCAIQKSGAAKAKSETKQQSVVTARDALPPRTFFNETDFVFSLLFIFV